VLQIMRSAASGSDTVDAASPGKKPPRDEARQHAVTASVCCAAVSGLTELAAKSLSAFLYLAPHRLRLTPDCCKLSNATACTQNKYVLACGVSLLSCCKGNLCSMACAVQLLIWSCPVPAAPLVPV